MKLHRLISVTALAASPWATRHPHTRRPPQCRPTLRSARSSSIASTFRSRASGLSSASSTPRGGAWCRTDSFDPKARVGVVVLSNAGTPAGPDDIGRHLLDSESPLLAPQAAPKTRTEVAIDPPILDRYVGRYQLAPTAIISVTRDGAHQNGRDIHASRIE
jgi:hypothetical protein